MKKESIQNLIKAVAFVLIFAVVMVLLGDAFVPKRSDPESGIANANARGFYGEPKNSIDVVMLGDSNAYSACSPMYIWNKYGISSYVAAEGFQSVAGALGILDEVLTCQKPKLVVFDVNMLWTGKTYMKKIENNLKKVAYRLLPLTRYHDRWKNMEVSDVFEKKDYTYRSASRGQYLSMKVKPYIGKSKMVKTDDIEDIPIISRLFLEKLIRTCRDNDISLVFVETPTAKSWNYGRHNAMTRYAEEKGIDFVDLNLMTGEYAIDWSSDTRDGGSHLNCVGAEKASAYLGKYISGHYTFEDKRDDPQYAQWNEDYMSYKEFISGEKLATWE